MVRNLRNKHGNEEMLTCRCISCCDEVPSPQGQRLLGGKGIGRREKQLEAAYVKRGPEGGGKGRRASWVLLGVLGGAALPLLESRTAGG